MAKKFVKGQTIYVEFEEIGLVEGTVSNVLKKGYKVTFEDYDPMVLDPEDDECPALYAEDEVDFGEPDDGDPEPEPEPEAKKKGGRKKAAEKKDEDLTNDVSDSLETNLDGALDKSIKGKMGSSKDDVSVEDEVDDAIKNTDDDPDGDEEGVDLENASRKELIALVKEHELQDADGFEDWVEMETDELREALINHFSEPEPEETTDVPQDENLIEAIKEKFAELNELINQLN